MKKRWVAGLLVVCLCAGILAGCDYGDKYLGTPAGPYSDTQSPEASSTVGAMDFDNSEDAVEEDTYLLVSATINIIGDALTGTDDKSVELSSGETWTSSYPYNIYTYDENGNLLTESKKNTQGDSEEIINSYDEYGNLISHEVNKNGELKNKTVYTYYDNGKIKTKTEDVYSGTTGEQTYTQTFSYNEKGHEIRQEFIGYGSVFAGQHNIIDTEYTYSSSDKILCKVVTDHTAGYSYQVIRTYDENDNIISESTIGDGVNVHDRNKTWVVDDAGNILKYDDGSGKESEYTYDSAGNVLSAAIAYSTGYNDLTTYEYDEAGNILKVSQITWNNNGDEYPSYEIIYERSVEGELIRETKNVWSFTDGLIPDYIVSCTHSADGMISAKEIITYNTIYGTSYKNYEYDENGNVIAYSVWYSKFGADKKYTVTFEYQKITK